MTKMNSKITLKTLFISIMTICAIAFSFAFANIANSVSATGEQAGYGISDSTATTMESWDTTWIDHYLNEGNGIDPKFYDGDTQIEDTNNTDGQITIGGTSYNIDGIKGGSFTISGINGVAYRNLPAGYTQVEYIQSTGTQYIDTGFTANQNTKIDIKFKSTSSIFGGEANYSDRAFHLYKSGNSFDIGFGTQLTGGSGTYDQNKIYNLVMDRTSCYVYNLTDNNTQYSKTYTASNFTAPYTTTLFALHRSSISMSAGTIYYCKIYDNGTLVHDYVPAIYNDVAGLYDFVTNTFETNDGIGAFTPGAVVISSNYYGSYTIENGIYKSGIKIGELYSTAQHNTMFNVTSGNETTSFYIQNGKVYVAGSNAYACDVNSNWMHSLTLSDETGIPSGYTQVEYIETNGLSGQYISTGITGPAKWTYEMAWKDTSIRQRMGYNGGSGYWGINSGKYEGTNIAVVQDRIDTIIWNCTGRSYQLIVNGVVGRTGFSTDGICQVLALGGSYLNKAKLYSCKVEQNGAIVRYYIPVRRSDNVYGVYDIINGTFTKASGNTDFTGGNEISKVDSSLNGTYYFDDTNIYNSTGTIVDEFYNNGTHDNVFTLGEGTEREQSFYIDGNSVYRINGTYYMSINDEEVFALNNGVNNRYYRVSYASDNTADYGWYNYYKYKNYNVSVVKESADVFYYSELSDFGIFGEGTESDPYIISNVEQLTYIAYMMRENTSGKATLKWGSAQNAFQDKWFKLTNDLDLSGYKWVSLGYYSASDTYKQCKANFDFDNHTISHLCDVDNSTSHMGGLFDTIGVGSTIKNLILSNAYVTSANSYCGLLSGDVKSSTLKNITIKNSTFNTSSGGACSIGYAEGTTIDNMKVENSYFTSIMGTSIGYVSFGVGYGTNVTVNGFDVNHSKIYGKSMIYVGGVVGLAVNGISISDVTLDDETLFTGGMTEVGGVVGYSNCTNLVITDVVNEAMINTSGSRIGGIVGGIYGTNYRIENCENYGTIAGASECAGIIGAVSANSNRTIATIKNCNNYGVIIGANWMGGIVGGFRHNSPSCTATILNCYNYGSLFATSYKVGGILGEASSVYSMNVSGQGYYNNTKYLSAPVLVKQCENFGNVTSSSEQVGGLVGFVGSTSTTLEQCANKGTVTGSIKIGGFVGLWNNPSNAYVTGKSSNDNYITNCYNLANITGTSTSYYMVTGFIGSVEINGTNAGDNTTALTVSHCYSWGTITGCNYNGYNLACISYSSNNATSHKVIFDDVYVKSNSTATATATSTADYYFNNVNAVNRCTTSWNYTIATNKNTILNLGSSSDNFDFFANSDAVTPNLNGVWSKSQYDNGFNGDKGFPYLVNVDALKVNINDNNKVKTYEGFYKQTFTGDKTYTITATEVVGENNKRYAITTGDTTTFVMDNNTYTITATEVVCGDNHYPIITTSSVRRFIIEADKTVKVSTSGIVNVNSDEIKTFVNIPVGYEYRGCSTNPDGTGEIKTNSIQINATYHVATLISTKNSRVLNLYPVFVEKAVKILKIILSNDFENINSANTLIVYYDSNKNYMKATEDAKNSEKFTVATDLSTTYFYKWQIYKSKDNQWVDLNNVINGVTFNASFDLLTLVKGLYANNANNIANYLVADTQSLGAIKLRSIATSSTYTVTADFDNTKGSVTFGTTLTPSIPEIIVFGLKYNIVVTANEYRYITVVEITMGEDTQRYENTTDQTVQTYTQSLEDVKAITGNVTISVTYGTIDYLLDFETLDSNMMTIDSLNPEGIFTTTEKVNIDKNLPTFTYNAPSDWQLMGWYVKNNNIYSKLEVQNLTSLSDIEVNSTFLDDYLIDNKVVLYAVFTRLYTVTASVNGSNGTYTICYGSITNDVTSRYSNDGVFNATFVEDSMLYFIAIPDSDCILDATNTKLLVDGQERMISGYTTSLTLSGNVEFIVKFQEFAYTIELKAYNTNGTVERNYINDTTIKIADPSTSSEQSATLVKKGQYLTSISTDMTKAEGKHRFDSYQIWSASENGYVDFDIEQPIKVTDGWIAEYSVNDVIKVRTIYCLQYQVNIALADLVTPMGSFIVKVYKPVITDSVTNYECVETLTNNGNGYTQFSAYFDKGYRVEVIETPIKGYAFDQFFPSNDTAEGNKITLKVTKTHNLSLYYETEKFTLNLANLTFAGGTIDITANNRPLNAESQFTGIEVGDKIIVAFKPQMGYEVKSFTINGQNVTSLPGAELNSNVLTLTVTSELLEGLNATNDIDIGVSASLAMIYLIVLIGAPTLLLVILVIIITNIISTKKLRAQVTARLNKEFAQNMKFDAAGLVKGLKEGRAVGQVTEEDIKREMKNEKKK